MLRCSFWLCFVLFLFVVRVVRKRGKSNLRFFGVGHSVKVAVLNAGVVVVVVVVGKSLRMTMIKSKKLSSF